MGTSRWRRVVPNVGGVLIVYRFAPEPSRRPDRPDGFTKEVAFRSLLTAVEHVPGGAHLVAVVDGTEPAPAFLAGTVDDLVASGQRRGSSWSFLQALEVASRWPHDDFVLLAEDDYLYRREALDRLAAAHRALGGSASPCYLTPYEHPDVYRLADRERGTEVSVLDGTHWRTCASTCMTFGASVSRLERDAAFLRLAAGVDGTASWRMWDALLRRRRADLVAWSTAKNVLARRRRGRPLAGHAADVLTVLSRRARGRLLAPIPSLAAHATRGQLPYGRTWADFGLPG